MSADAPTPTTKREVLIARAAFCEGVKEAWRRFVCRDEVVAPWPGSQTLAAARYPLPTVTRPRTITVPEHKAPDGIPYPSDTFRAVDGAIEGKFGDEWLRTSFDPTAPRVAAWQDLLNNPTETVEDDTP